LRKGALTLLRPPQTARPMEDIVIGLIALGLLAYLVAAVLRPEKF
jgi:K+-transporting ATPase KdpF subunit